MFGFEIYFLWVLAIIWIIFAVVEDIRTREIANWLNYSLAFFAIGFRFFYSLFELNSFDFFYQGVIGLAIFIVIGNLLYYGKMFAGGDAKLMMALGAVLPIYWNTILNFKIFGLFLFLFLLSGAIYGIIVSVVYGFVNFSLLKDELKKQFSLNRSKVNLFLTLSGVLVFGSFFIFDFFYVALFTLFIFYFYLYVKSIDEACMVKNLNVMKVTEGDWLYADIVVHGKKIKATWDGLSLEELNLIRKFRKNVLIRQGIQFAPVFLISFILMVLVLVFGWFGF
jgi:Flp pilus assembly protein protease CpaA